MINTSKKIYSILFTHYGPQYWWPIDKKYHIEHKSDPRFEIILGAILTQNTAWSNVEKTLHKLKQSNMLTIDLIASCDEGFLKQLIRSSGFFNQKAERLTTLANYLKKKYKANLDLFFDKPLSVLRKELLNLKGIGPETADSILLYAGDKPIFVVDAYTKRLFQRIPVTMDLTYDAIQHTVENELSKVYTEKELPSIYNEFHALIVHHAKNYCKTKPLCKSCIFQDECMYAKKNVIL